jgi:hypothetical protein
MAYRHACLPPDLGLPSDPPDLLTFETYRKEWIMKKIVAGISLALLTGVLVGCAAPSQELPAGGKDSPAPQVSLNSSQAISLVKERYAECLALFEIQGDFIFTPSARVPGLGEVMAVAPGQILVWDVGYDKTGGILTIPADSSTTQALASVGC